MSGTDYKKYLINNPLREISIDALNRQSPLMTYMSERQVPGANCYICLGWIYGMPEPNPYGGEQVAGHDKVVLYWGIDYKNPEELGAEIEFPMGGQSLTFDTSSALYIPKGTRHGPVTWKRCERPHMEMTMILGSGSPDSGNPGDNAVESNDIEHEKFLIRKPAYEVMPETPTKNRMNPSMTFLNNDLIPGCDTYLEFSWIWGMPDQNPPIMEHKHDDYNEVVFHIGSDPDNPEDLGAEIDLYMESQALKLDKTCTVFAPRGVKHGPLKWKSVSRPHIEMAIIFGAGALAQSDPGGHQERMGG
jgi:hypothetical protein